MYWHNNPRVKAGGTWRCTAKRRQYDKNRKRRKSETEMEKDRQRMRDYYAAQKRKERLRYAKSNGWIPCAPVTRIIREWLEKQDDFVSPGNFLHQDKKIIPISGMERLHFITGLQDLWHIKRGRNKWIDFDRADKIITAIDVRLWRCDPELREIYEEFDLATLDRLNPVTESAA